jgi:hypothetical protein
MNSMGGVITIAIVVAAAIYLELVPLFKKRWYKEAAVYSIILAIGTPFAVCATNLLYIPSPMWLLVKIFGPLAKAVGLAS